MLTSIVSLLQDVAATRRAFKNWLSVGVIAGIGATSRIPPRGGWPRLAARRMQFETRLGPILEAEIGNAAPIVEVFRDAEYSIPIDWTQVRTVIDVGGHVGAFAAWVAVQARQARIVIFEPEQATFQDLEANMKRNGLLDRVTLKNAAVGEADGKRLLHVPNERYAASFTRMNGGRVVEVECLALERYLGEHRPHRIDVLKLDCEGAEWEILESLHSASFERVTHIFVECHARTTEEVAKMIRLLEGRGFVVHVRYKGGWGPYPIMAILWAEPR